MLQFPHIVLNDYSQELESLNKLIVDYGIQQKDVAKLVGIHPSNLCGILKGKTYCSAPLFFAIRKAIYDLK